MVGGKIEGLMPHHAAAYSVLAYSKAGLSAGWRVSGARRDPMHRLPKLLWHLSKCFNTVMISDDIVPFFNIGVLRHSGALHYYPLVVAADWKFPEQCWDSEKLKKVLIMVCCPLEGSFIQCKCHGSLSCSSLTLSGQQQREQYIPPT